MPSSSESLHDRILSEFGNRIETADEIPTEVVQGLEELDRYGLEDADKIESIVDEEIDYETE